jgi:hypothetical protein
VAVSSYSDYKITSNAESQPRSLLTCSASTATSASLGLAVFW